MEFTEPFNYKIGGIIYEKNFCFCDQCINRYCNNQYDNSGPAAGRGGEETKEELQAVQQDKKELSKEKDILQDLAGRYHRIVRVLGNDMVEDIVQRDIQNQKILEEKRRMEQMPQGSIKERMAWAEEKRRMENQQRKKNRKKNRGMEL